LIILTISLSLAGTQIATTTDSEGEFNIDSIPAGIYTLSVTANGYQPWSMGNIEIKDEEQTEVEVKMVK